jgi:hypothetical protein
MNNMLKHVTYENETKHNLRVCANKIFVFVSRTMKTMCSITSMIEIENKYSCAKYTTFITTMPFVNLTGFLEYIYIYIPMHFISC